MRKLTDEEKEILKKKIKVERVGKHQKEQKLIAHRQQYRKHSGAQSITSGFSMVKFSGESYSSRLRKAKRDKAFNYVFDKSEPLRRIKLTDAEKKALKKKIGSSVTLGKT